MPLPAAFPSCPKIQEDLKLLMHKMQFDTDIPGMDDISFIRALKSTVNTGNELQVQVAPSEGRKKSVERRYSRRLPISEAGTDSIKVCGSPNKIGRLIDTVEFDGTGVNHHFDVTTNDLTDMCEDDETYMATNILKSMSVCLRALDARLNVDALPLVGKWETTQTGLVGDVLTYATRDTESKIDEDPLTEIMFAKRNAEYKSTPFIMGWNEQVKFFDKVNFGCCTQFGQDIGELARSFDGVFFGNRNTPATFGFDGALMWEPGSLQLITYNEYKGPKGLRVVMDDTQQQTIFIDPWVGLEWDYWSTKIPCGDWTFGIKLEYKLVGMPDNMFHVGDNQEGNRMVHQLNIVNP